MVSSINHSPIPSTTATRGPDKPVLETKPAFRKRSASRKRAANAVTGAALLSMVQAFFGEGEKVTRARDKNTKDPVQRGAHSRRQQWVSLLDRLLAARSLKNLPPVIDALHQVLGEYATIKHGGDAEQKIRPYLAAYFGASPREDLLRLNDRLNVLAGAESLFAVMNETNRQDVQAVIEALKRATMCELAVGDIGRPLTLLADTLGETRPSAKSLADQWRSLTDRVGKAVIVENLSATEYLCAGLSGLAEFARPDESEERPAWGNWIESAGWLRRAVLRIGTLAQALSEQAPVLSGMAGATLEDVVRDLPPYATPHGMEYRLGVDVLRDAVRAHIDARLENLAAELADRLDKAVRADVRVAEVAEHGRSGLHDAIRRASWIHVNPGAAAA